jgi:hypothetical protein
MDQLELPLGRSAEAQVRAGRERQVIERFEKGQEQKKIPDSIFDASNASQFD